MENIAILLFVLGGGMAVYGVIGIVKIFRQKVITAMPFSEEPVQATFDKAGTYALVVLGLQHFKNRGRFALQVTGAGGRSVYGAEKKLKINRYYNGRHSKEYLQFSIDVPGRYILQLQNPADLRATGLQRFAARGDGSAQIPNGFVIREASGGAAFILTVLALALGFQAITFGILLKSGVFN